jgi:hypothetical protein
MRHCPNCGEALSRGVVTCPACFMALVDGSSSEAYQPGPFRRVLLPWRHQAAIVLGIVVGAALGSVIERGFGVLTLTLILAGAMCGLYLAQRLLMGHADD